MACTDDTLTLIQAEWVKMMSQTGQQLAITPTGDGRGGLLATGGYAAVGGEFPCLAYPHGQKSGDTVENESGAHIVAIEAWNLLTEVTVDLNLRDRVQVDGDLVLEISGSDKGQAEPWYITWRCVKVDLGVF